MGKHSSARPGALSSLVAAFKAKPKTGRHAPVAAATTAGGVLASVRSRPVLAAFMVPTVATAAVVASSLAMTPGSDAAGPQVVAESPVVVDTAQDQAPDEALDKAKKQAEAEPGKISLDVKTAAPSPSSTKESGSGAAPDENDGPSKSGASAGESGSCPMSYYGGGDGFDGQPTANGEIFDTNKLTAAHKSLPFGSKVKITNKANGKSVTVRINDRGPYHGARCIDLSKAAMEAVGGVGAGQIDGSYKVL